MPRDKRKPYIDRSGIRFGKLVVLWAAGWRPSGKDYRIVWACQCDCGTITIAYICDLQRGRTKSCGCAKVKKHNVNAMSLFCQYRHKAKARGLSWNLTFEQFLVLTSSPCHYTGWEPSQVFSQSKRHEPYIWNGIDRVVNEKGYTLENCVPCNGDVNKAKLRMSKEKFLNMCSSVVKTQEKTQIWKQELVTS